MRHWISTCSRCQPQQSRKEISRRVCQRLTQPIRVQKAGHSDLCSSLAFKPCIVFRVTCSPCNVLNLDTTTVLSPHLTGSITPFEKLLKQTGKGRQNTDSQDCTTEPSSGQNRAWSSKFPPHFLPLHKELQPITRIAATADPRTVSASNGPIQANLPPERSTKGGTPTPPLSAETRNLTASFTTTPAPQGHRLFPARNGNPCPT